jgi:hypothetical protein
MGSWRLVQLKQRQLAIADLAFATLSAPSAVFAVSTAALAAALAAFLFMPLLGSLPDNSLSNTSTQSIDETRCNRTLCDSFCNCYYTL